MKKYVVGGDRVQALCETLERRSLPGYSFSQSHPQHPDEIQKNTVPALFREEFLNQAESEKPGNQVLLCNPMLF